MTRGPWLSLAGALCLLAAQAARANPHELPFTYPYMTNQAGQFELEQAIDAARSRL